jgi:anti-anti-sigma factor
MAIRKREVDGIGVLDLVGDFYGGRETEALDRAIATEIALGNFVLVLNLAECRLMNSTAFGVLIGTHRVVEAMGGEITLCGAEGRMKHLLAVLHVGQLFAHFPTEDQALAAMGRRATA